MTKKAGLPVGLGLKPDNGKKRDRRNHAKSGGGRKKGYSQSIGGKNGGKKTNVQEIKTVSPKGKVRKETKQVEPVKNRDSQQQNKMIGGKEKMKCKEQKERGVLYFDGGGRKLVGRLLKGVVCPVQPDWSGDNVHGKGGTGAQ